MMMVMWGGKPIEERGMTEADEPETNDEQTDAEAYARSRKLPAIFVNNFYVAGTASGIRIAFAESAEQPIGPQYHAAVVLPVEDAKELARIVLRIVSEIENEARQKS